MKFFYSAIAFSVVCLLFFGAGELAFRLFGTSHAKTISAVGISIYQPSETDVWEHKPMAVDRNGYGDPTPEVSINSLGLRDSEFKEEMASDKNILVLGDSFTFGTGLWAKDTFPELLEGQIRSQFGPEWHVWNGGVIGTTVDDYYLRLKKYDALLHPKIVVVDTFVGNDVTELRRHTWKKDSKGDLIRVTDDEVYVNAKSQLESLDRPKPASLFWDFLKARFSILYYKFATAPKKPTLTWPVFLPSDHPATDPRLPKFWDRYFTALDLIRNYCDENGIKLLISINPMDTQVSKSYWKKYTPLLFDDEAFKADRPQKRILEYCDQNKVECLDLLPQFRENKQRDELYFLAKADPHFDKAGHRLVSDILFSRLAEFIKKYE